MSKVVSLRRYSAQERERAVAKAMQIGARGAGKLAIGQRVGRLPRYDPDIRERYEGAPRLNLRLDPDLHEWVQRQGGCQWVVEILRERRDGPTSPPQASHPTRPRFDAAEFLAALHASYQLKTGAPHGQVAKLLELHQVLTLLPSTRRVYNRQDFTVDVHELDRQYEAAQARTHLVFRLHRGATAAKNRRNLLILPIEGGELTYYGIEFFQPAAAPSR